MLLFFSVILILAIIIYERFCLKPLTITLINLFPVFIGYYNLDAKNSTSYYIFIFLGYLFFCGGYIFFDIFKRVNKTHNVGKENNEITFKERLTIYIFIFIVISFVIYHFAVGGIPVLSRNVEVDRFNFASSGLFGIPGRMYLFGLPFISIIITVLYFKYGREQYKKPFLLVWFMFIIFQFLSGFKGALLTIIFHVFLVNSISGNNWSIFRVIRLRNLVFLFIALLYAIFMSLSYGSVGVTSINDSFSYLFQRSTELAAIPGYYVLNNNSLFINQGFYHINDFLYYIDKYLKFKLSNNINFPLEMLVSSYLTGTPLSPDNFIVSVTLGGFVDLYSDLGLYLTIFVMFLIGLFFNYILVKAKKSNSIFLSTIYGFILLRTYTFLVNGSLIYNLVNTFLMILVFYFIFLFAKIVAEVIVGVGKRKLKNTNLIFNHKVDL